MTDHPFDGQEPEALLSQAREELERIAAQVLAIDDARRAACARLQAAIDNRNWRDAYRAARVLARDDARGLLKWHAALERCELLMASEAAGHSQSALDAQAVIHEAERLLSQQPGIRHSKEGVPVKPINKERMVPFVLTALKLKGPALQFKELTAAVQPRIAHLLTEADLDRYANGSVRWQVKLSGFKDHLRKRGLIDPHAPNGEWRITPQGSQLVDDWLEALTGATETDT